MHLLLHSRIQLPLHCSHQRLGMSKAAQPRPPCAEARCSRTRLGSGSPAGVGLGAAVWAGMVTGCLPPQTSLSWAGRARSCGGRAPRAVSTGTGCLACTAHAGASLLSALLRSPSPGAGEPAFRHPGGFPAAPSPGPLGCPLCRSPAGLGRASQERDEAAPFPPHFSCPEFVLHLFYYFIISLFYYFLMLALGLLTTRLPCSLTPCLWSSFLLLLPAPIKASRSKSSWFFICLFTIFITLLGSRAVGRNVLTP